MARKMTCLITQRLSLFMAIVARVYQSSRFVTPGLARAAGFGGAPYKAEGDGKLDRAEGRVLAGWHGLLR